MLDPVVKMVDVALRYGRGPEVLSGINLTLASASFYFVCGASGAGKSSFIRMLYLGHRPSSGVMTLFGQHVDHVSRNDLTNIRRQIGIIFQDFRLIPHYTIYQNVALPLIVRGFPHAEIRAQVVELLEWVGLGDHVDQCPPLLSGGQQQRVAIARAVVAHPRLLLADEPTGSVDDVVAMRVMYLLEELHRQGTAVVVATHNDHWVTRMGKPVIRLDRGRIKSVDYPASYVGERASADSSMRAGRGA